MKKKLLLLISLFFLQQKIYSQVTTQTFTCIGDTQTFVIPSCVTTLTVEAWGAGGGGGGWDSLGGSAGGGGAYVSSVLSVTPGQTLTIQVGCSGLPGGACAAAGPGGVGGFGLGNGGNGGNSGPSGCSGPGGGGGGGTGIKNGNTILLVAGGGGGGGGGGNYGDGANGGGGGQAGFSQSSPGGILGASATTDGLNGASTAANGAGGGGGGGGLKGGGGGQVPGTDYGGSGGAGGTNSGTTVISGNGQTPGNSGNINLCSGCAVGGTGATALGGTAASAGGAGELIVSYNGCSSINQFIQNNYSVKIYPNPAKNTITVQSSKELGTILIYNSLGEIIFQIKSKNTEEQIDVSKYQAGIYIVQTQGRYMKLIKE